MMLEWRMLFLLLALGGLLFVLLQLILSASYAPSRILLRRLIARFPAGWQQRLYAYAKSQDAFDEPLDVLIRQLAAVMVISVCLLLPLPAAVQLSILGGAVMFVVKRRNVRRLQLRRFCQQW